MIDVVKVKATCLHSFMYATATLAVILKKLLHHTKAILFMRYLKSYGKQIVFIWSHETPYTVSTSCQAEISFPKVIILQCIRNGLALDLKAFVVTCLWCQQWSPQDESIKFTASWLISCLYLLKEVEIQILSTWQPRAYTVPFPAYGSLRAGILWYFWV